MSKKAFVTHAAEPAAAYTPGSRVFQVAEDIVPIAEFKSKISEVVRRLDGRPRPIVITLNGKPAAVVMSPREYDRLLYNQRLMASVADGLADDASDNVITTDELLARMRSRYGAAEKVEKPEKRRRR